MRALGWTVAMIGAAMMAGCSAGSIGSSCAGSAVEDACEEGAVCAPDRSASVEPPEGPNEDTSTCRQICERQADCTVAGEECRRVEGSPFLACQPPFVSTDGGA